MGIREYAAKVGFTVVGKLTRLPEFEYETNWFDGSKKHIDDRCYFDEGGNEYWTGPKGICIVDTEGGVI